MRRQGKKTGSFASRLKPTNTTQLKKTEEKISAILVSRQSGGIGDLLMITPTIRAIKEANPKSPLIVSVTDHYGVKGVLFDILKHNPYIDKVVGTADLLTYSFNKIYNFNTGKEIPMEMDRSHPTGNRIDIFAELAEVYLKDKKPIYVVTSAEKEWAKNWIQKNISKNKRRLIGIQVSTSTIRRNWPMEKQWLLAFKLINKYPEASILFFHEGAAPETEVYPNIFQIEGMPLRWVAALINECELMIVPDSGLLHIAGALGRKIVGIFGPNAPDTRLLYYENSVGVWLSYPCSVQYCWYERCHYGFKCIKEIPVEMVIGKAVDLLEGNIKPLVRREKGGTLILRMGGVGDLIALSSSIRKYKERHPEEEITLATKPENIDVLKGAPFLKEIIPIPKSYRYFYNKIIDLRFKVESPEVGGTLDTDIYKTKNRMDIFDSLLGVIAGEKKPYVWVDPSTVEKLKKRIKYSNKYKYLGIHSTCTSNTRTVPPEYLPKLAKLFNNVKGLRIVLFGNLEFWGGRAPKIELLKIKGKFLTNLINKTTLPELTALCSLMDFIIGPDSSVIHIAGALEKKCVALYGNIDPYTRIFYYPTVKALYPKNELSCIPCWDFQNPCSITDELGGACIRLLTPERIFEESKEWFQLNGGVK